MTAGVTGVASRSFPSRSFHGRNGTAEHFLAIEAPGLLPFDRQLDLLEARYAEACQALRLEPDTAVFRRVLVSDAVNQAPLVRAGTLAGGENNPVALSVVQQPPLRGGKAALLAYHVAPPGGLRKRQVSPRHLLIERNGLKHLWSTGMCAGNGNPHGVSAAAQTDAVFGQLTSALAAQGGTLAASCLRTWIYVKDVDLFYHDLVAARTDLFARHGLGRDSHFIASTGIEGACAHPFDVVSMDAYSVIGVRPEQVTYLDDLDAMCRTLDYNVTFERGTRLRYADRDHLLISGTASIDRSGKVVHAGDVLAQLDRALANMDAVLRAGGAGLGDLMHMLVYLRDPADFASIDAALRERLPWLPALIVQGPVCRPEWLVEVEGIAVAPGHFPGMPEF